MPSNDSFDRELRNKKNTPPELSKMMMELSEQIKELLVDKKSVQEKLDVIVMRNDEVLKRLDQNAEKIESLQRAIPVAELFRGGLRLSPPRSA